MTPADLLKVFRIEVSDLAEPYLWSKELIMGYIEDAQRQFCRKTEGIEDGRSFKIRVEPGKEWYNISPLILKLRKATITASGGKINIVNSERADAEGVRFDGRTGPVNSIVVGIEKHAVRAWPSPSTSMVIELSVFRLPREFSENGELEVDEQHARGLLLWVKHLAYSVQDSEVFDRLKADDFEQKFEAYCAQAKREQSRARREVGAVVYGGL